MGDEGTASGLVLAGAIIQLIVTILFFVIAGLMFAFLAAFTFDPIIAEYFWLISLTVSSVFVIIGIFNLIFAILWFNWRNNPGQHKTGLIVTGIIALIFAGFIGGLLALIGGAIAPENGKFVTGAPSWTPTPTKAPKFCTICGTQIEPDDKYCPKCGALLSH